MSEQKFYQYFNASFLIKLKGYFLAFQKFNPTVYTKQFYPKIFNKIVF